MVKLLHFPKIEDFRGNLTYLQNLDQIPFMINKVFWTYNIKGGTIDEWRASLSKNEIIIALSGSFDVIVRDDNYNEELYRLSKSNVGLLISSMNFLKLENFSTNALVLHISD